MTGTDVRLEALKTIARLLSRKTGQEYLTRLKKKKEEKAKPAPTEEPAPAEATTEEEAQ